MDQNDSQPVSKLERRASIASQDSQTAADYISGQLQLEADAREVLPYQFDTCTYPLGPLNQSVFSCLTCDPQNPDTSASYVPAGVCYACSISCHGEHELVELFTRRNFVCDCGTTRLPATSTCSLRINMKTGTKGGVHSDVPSTTNTYNHNFRNRFCGCAEDYDPHSEKGTMFQCLGLATPEQGGCGEDWWHPECVIGLPRNWFKSGELNASGGHEEKKTSIKAPEEAQVSSATNGSSTALESIAEEGDGQPVIVEEPMVDAEEHPVPPGFPKEEDFDHFICYKCVEVYPWIKRYANSPGFLPALPYGSITAEATKTGVMQDSKPWTAEISAAPIVSDIPAGHIETLSLKRKADEINDETAEPALKKSRSEDSTAFRSTKATPKHASLPAPRTERVSLFVTGDFRDHFCRCAECFPKLAEHPQLLEEEMIYEPPVSDGSSAGGEGTSSVGSRSLFDRGEAALSNVDRVRAIEGVMAYNKLRDNLKSFLKPFAESGQAVGAEDIKKHFEKLRGDDQAIREAQGRASESR